MHTWRPETRRLALLLTATLLHEAWDAARTREAAELAARAAISSAGACAARAAATGCARYEVAADGSMGDWECARHAQPERASERAR
jgi:hypothetical protein